MDGGTGPGSEVLSPCEAEWPPELRLPPPPPPPPAPEPLPPAPDPPPRQQLFTAPHLRSQQSPPRHTQGFDDQQFLGSIMADAAPAQQPQPPAGGTAAAPPVKRKRGRPPKNRDGAAVVPAPPKPASRKEEEVVCFICFDGGNLVVCDRRGCPKVYHPACIKRDESFFQARGKWDCGWHICSSCEKAVQYMCYTCTYSVCKGCIKQDKFFSVRGNKGFCDTCYGTIVLIESKDDGAKVGVDFDDKSSWEYLFKLYWLDLKGKHSLTLEELISAKKRWVAPATAGRKEKEESSDELYDANNDHDANFDISSRKRRRNNSSGKRGQKRQKDSCITTRNGGVSTKSSGGLPGRLSSEGVALPSDLKWASSELLEFIGHIRNGDTSYISQFDVQVLLLEYIKQNNLRDPRKKSQIICDARLSNLFRKQRVGHFEMLKLLEAHLVAKETQTETMDSQRGTYPDSAQVDNGGIGSDKRRKVRKNTERELTANTEDYAAIDMHNIKLIYLRRNLMEELMDDSAFSDKIAGAFVRIRISGLGQKQDMYRLVKVIGTHKVSDPYSVGKRTTNYALEISNLDKKEIITMDTVSNQDFTEDECKRLRQSMKFGLISRLKVGDIYEKAKVFQSLRVKEWLENEKQRLSHLRDRASETGRRKQLRECVEQLQLLNSSEEMARRINEVPEVHVDPRMAPNYESAEELDYKKAVDWTINRNGPDLPFPGRKETESNSTENRTHKSVDASGHMSSLPTEDLVHRSAGTNINLNSAAVEAAPVLPSGVISSDTEAERVWHYKDPSGTVQGPFTLSQLSDWAVYFPRDLRVWLTFEGEENSLLLTEVLPKQQTGFIQPIAGTPSDTSKRSGTGNDTINSNSVVNNSSSSIGYNVAYPSTLSSQPAESLDRLDPTKGPALPGGALPSRSLKDAHILHGQVQHQVNYSRNIPSSAGSYRPPNSYNEGILREQVGKWNSSQDNDGVWLSNHSCQRNVEQLPDGCTMKKQLQNDTKSNSLAGFLENLDSEKASVHPPQQAEQDPADSHDDLRLSIALAKPESCLPTNPVEDRDTISASGVPSQSEPPSCLPHPVPLVSMSNSSKTEVTMVKHKTCSPDTSTEPFDKHREPQSYPMSLEAQDRECKGHSQPVPSVSMPDASKTEAAMTRHKTFDLGVSTKLFDQHPEPKRGPIFSSKTQDLECEVPTLTPKVERKETSMKQSESPAAPEDLDTEACVHSVSFEPGTPGIPSDKTDVLQSLNETPCLEESHLRERGVAQTRQLNEDSTLVETNNIMVNPVSDTEGTDVSDVLGSVAEQDCEKYNIHRAAPSENLVPASAEEEQPQCSSPIALSPWGEPSYYQGEAVDSALWSVQDDPSNDMWSLHSPTPALQPSSLGLGADGKDVSCIMEAVIVARGNDASVETLPSQGEKKMELGTSNASASSEAPKQVKPKPNAASAPTQDGATKASGSQPSASPVVGSEKAPGWKPPGLSLEGITSASGLLSSGSSTEGSTKAVGWQRSTSSPHGSRKASGWQTSVSTEGTAKSSGWQGSSTSPEGGRKTSAWQRSGSCTPRGIFKAADAPAKVDGWQKPSSSPEGSKNASGWNSWNSSVRESSKVNSTSGSNENRKSSTGPHATTPTAKHSSEAPKRQGNGDKNTAGWGEAPGSNRSWHSSSGNASRGSHGSHQHRDRHSHGNDSWRGNSSHSRRFDHRHDHGSGGSSRPSSRGHGQRGVCKYYENGNCRKGSNCQYLHR